MKRRINHQTKNMLTILAVVLALMICSLLLFKNTNTTPSKEETKTDNYHEAIFDQVVDNDINQTTEVQKMNQSLDNASNKISDIDKSINSKNYDIRVVKSHKFNRPKGITFDSEGNMFVVNFKGNNIMVFNQTFEEIRSFNNQFSYPHSIDFDKKGLYYVAEYSTHRIQKISPDGETLGILGVDNSGELTEEFAESTANKAAKNRLMTGIATAHFDKNKKSLLVTDYGASAIIKFTADGKFIGWIGAKNDGTITDGWEQTGTPKESAELGGLTRPHGAKEGFDGNIYVTDTWNHRVQKFNNDGEFVGWIGAKSDGSLTNGWKTAESSSSSALPGGFNAPISIEFDQDMNLYILEYANHRIQKFNKDGEFIGWFGKTKDGEVTNGWSTEGISEKGHGEGMFFNPYDFVLRNSLLFISDTGNERIQIIRIKN